MGFHQVTVFHAGGRRRAQALQALALGRFGCQGIEEYSLSEPEVDALLGARSYSGGDLPQDVLDEVDGVMSGRDVHLKFFFEEGAAGDARSFAEEVRREFLCEVVLESKNDEDWNAEWKKHYRPIQVEGGLVILPEWEDAAAHAHQTVLRIHPGMGFGTGSHETTFLCLREYLRFAPVSPAHVLDYGSGSGILGLATLLTHVGSRADFVDIDLEAHRNCRQNLDLNGVNPGRARLLLVNERSELRPPYDVVFANILQDVLHAERDFLVAMAAPGSPLILSGLLCSQLSETRSLYLDSGKVELLVEETLNDWGCLVFRRMA